MTAVAFLTTRVKGPDTDDWKKLVRLLGLGYALRVKLPLFIFAGFAFSHLIINYIPRIVLELDFEEEEVQTLLKRRPFFGCLK